MQNKKLSTVVSLWQLGSIYRPIKLFGLAQIFTEEGYNPISLYVREAL
jgi:hypothetical protein